MVEHNLQNEQVLPFTRGYKICFFSSPTAPAPQKMACSDPKGTV
jgi:hypothetical protein